MQKGFLGFSNYVNDLYQITTHLNIITHPLVELVQNVVAFYWTETCKEAFEKLKLYVNSETYFSYYDKSM